MSEKPSRPRSHEDTAAQSSMERAKRIGPHMARYQRQIGETALPPDLRIELKDPADREQGWRMSLTDGVPIPEDAGGFLGDEPPFGDPL